MNWAGLHILMVDDDPRLVRLYQRWLEQRRAVVDIAYSGNTALKTLHEASFELLLLDLNMPDGDGYDVLAKASRLPPVIIMTGIEPDFDRVPGHLRVELLRKPVKPADLDTCAESLLVAQ